MHHQLDRPDDFDAWRDAARISVAQALTPEQVSWAVKGETQDLFSKVIATTSNTSSQPSNVVAPRRFIELARSACLHRDPARFGLLYRLLWRMQLERGLMEDLIDVDVRATYDLAKSVRRDMHKMRAFVRFRSIIDDNGVKEYLAWFEPDHHIVRANAPFFHARFAGMRWTIVTPDMTLGWNGQTFTEGPGGSRSDIPAEDAVEEMWKGYYRAIFNPARLKIGAMTKEMPKKYWANMPETALIGDMVASARSRELRMIADSPTMPESRPDSMVALREALSRCTRCTLHCNAAQVVPGEGPEVAALMVVGEQPGDEEDRSGRPFVGPAGQILNAALRNAGIEREAAYVTNAVKHFKFRRGGKIRLHQSPNAGEIDHCRWWLDLERSHVRPKVILALGASAARGVLGRTHNVETLRKKPTRLSDGTVVCVTYHPSYLLRVPDNQKTELQARFEADVCAAHLLVAQAS